MNNSNMNKLIYLASLLLLLLTGCKDDIDISTLSNREKMVVYCMPTVSDTTYIFVSRSIPVKSYNDSVKISTVDNAHIQYAVNGEKRDVEHIGKGYYRVVGKQQAGDQVTLGVSAEGLESVSGTTAIPEIVPVSDISVRNVSVYDNEYDNKRDLTQVTATFTDNAATRDYYAVRVKVKHYDGYAKVCNKEGWTTEYFSTYEDFLSRKDEKKEDSVELVFADSAYSYPRVETQSEDLLMPVGSVDDFFGFSNDFFGNLCIFDDSAINGMTYTLHLNVDRYLTFTIYDDEAHRATDYNFAKAFQVELLRISPDYYRFLRAINDVDNNDLARAGFSQIRPMESNVIGGLGLLGGWNTGKTAWKMKTPTKTNKN
jgi:hypothetical protein